MEKTLQIDAERIPMWAQVLDSGEKLIPVGHEAIIESAQYQGPARLLLFKALKPGWFIVGFDVGPHRQERFEKQVTCEPSAVLDLRLEDDVLAGQQVRLHVVNQSKAPGRFRAIVHHRYIENPKQRKAPDSMSHPGTELRFKSDGIVQPNTMVTLLAVSQSKIRPYLLAIDGLAWDVVDFKIGQRSMGWSVDPLPAEAFVAQRFAWDVADIGQHCYLIVKNTSAEARPFEARLLFESAPAL